MNYGPSDDEDVEVFGIAATDTTDFEEVVLAGFIEEVNVHHVGVGGEKSDFEVDSIWPFDNIEFHGVIPPMVVYRLILSDIQTILNL